MSDPIAQLFQGWVGFTPNFLGDLPRVTFTASGSIEPNSRFVVADSASAITLTLTPGERAGQPLIIKNLGAGTLTLTANVDGTAGNTSVAAAGVVRLIWSADHATWLSV